MADTDESKPNEAPEGQGTSTEGPKWEQRSDFAINGRMKEVIRLTLDATRAQIDLYRRKIDKLTYGS